MFSLGKEFFHKMISVREVLDRVQINMPFRMLYDTYLPMVLAERINPEIGLDCFALDRFEKDDFLRIAGELRNAGLSITFHAPFYDLRPGAMDPKIRQVTIDRLKQVFDLVPYFSPLSIVCHASFDSKYYVTHEDLWLENSTNTWQYFADMAAEMNTTIALENVYEKDPVMLSRLFDALRESDGIRFCFDTGHFNAFSTAALDDWTGSLGSRLFEVHMHDNSGSSDEHVPVGDGSFSFIQLFEFLSDRRMRPIITCEPHTEENLWRTVKSIRDLQLLEYLE
jgi:sugar phosphate isomerase/epimerase